MSYAATATGAGRYEENGKHRSLRSRVKIRVKQKSPKEKEIMNVWCGMMSKIYMGTLVIPVHFLAPIRSDLHSENGCQSSGLPFAFFIQYIHSLNLFLLWDFCYTLLLVQQWCALLLLPPQIYSALSSLLLETVESLRYSRSTADIILTFGSGCFGLFHSWGAIQRWLNLGD